MTPNLTAVNPGAYEIMTFLTGLVGSIGIVSCLAFAMWLATVVAL
jgi:hypothetical protein